MAKINNLAVIQKLIDDLRLYPGKDVIPTEIAEKILPVFQINDTAVNLVSAGEVKELRDITLNDNDKTFTVPPGFVWEVMFGHCEWITTATAGNRDIQFEILNDNNEVVYRVLRVNSQAASITETYNFLSGGIIVNETVAGFHNFPIPDKMFLPEGFQLRIFDINNRDTADDLSYHFVVREIPT